MNKDGFQLEPEVRPIVSKYFSIYDVKNFRIYNNKLPILLKNTIAIYISYQTSYVKIFLKACIFFNLYQISENIIPDTFFSAFVNSSLTTT